MLNVECFIRLLITPSPSTLAPRHQTHAPTTRERKHCHHRLRSLLRHRTVPPFSSLSPTARHVPPSGWQRGPPQAHGRNISFLRSRSANKPYPKRAAALTRSQNPHPCPVQATRRVLQCAIVWRDSTSPA